MGWPMASKAESGHMNGRKYAFSHGHLAQDFPLRQYLCPQGTHLPRRVIFQESQKSLRSENPAEKT